jgi:hypothetical protein
MSFQQILHSGGRDFVVEIGRGDELGSRAMASVVSHEAYFETGLDVLSDLGYGGLKLAEVCNRLGVTTGSFAGPSAARCQRAGVDRRQLLDALDSGRFASVPDGD